METPTYKGITSEAGRAFSPTKSKLAFTLAEVLITLGIIGIVAAMTMPTVMSHYKKQEATARLKKFYSAMSQAITLSEIDNGDFKYWDINDITEPRLDDGSHDYDLAGEKEEIFFNKYLAKYLKYDKFIKGGFSTDEDGNKTGLASKIYFYDGTVVRLNKGQCFDLIVDVNGEKKPNKYAYDQFYFLICPYGNVHKLYPGEKLSSYDGQTGRTREAAYNSCKRLPTLCTRLLQFDNWEFKDDYPYKL